MKDNEKERASIPIISR